MSEHKLGKIYYGFNSVFAFIGTTYFDVFDSNEGLKEEGGLICPVVSLKSDIQLIGTKVEDGSTTWSIQ